MASRSESARVRTDPRISRRRQAVARTKRRRAGGLAIGLALFAAAVWATFWSPLLDVREVVVAGAKQTSAVDVRRAAGLNDGDNLLLVPTGEIAASVEELPWVREADVHRRLPGTVRIKVVERKPALVVTVESGTWTIDRAGRVLDEGAVEKSLPTLTGAVLASVELGESLGGSEIRAGLSVWRSLSKKVKTEVASVVAPSATRIALALRDGTLVRYGGADHLKSKNEVLAALMTRLSSEGRRATYIDISVPTSPAVGPAPQASPMPTPSV